LARLIPTPITASPTDAKSWRDAMQHLEQSSGLAMIGAWDKVEQQLRECSELLQINEKIIGNMRQGVNQFLNLLRGQTGSGQTYGATGKAEIFSDNPTITSA
jgi:flagellar biosynthesis/type III secretory pathway chaperone